MHHVIYMKDLFKSIPEIKKIVIKMFSNKNLVDFLHECGLLKIDINRLCLEYLKILLDEMMNLWITLKKKKNHFWKEFLRVIWNSFFLKRLKIFDMNDRL